MRPRHLRKSTLLQKEEERMFHRGSRLPLLFFLVCALLVRATVRGQEVQRDVRYYSQQAAKAYEEKNYAAYLENMRLALSLRPGNPTLLYNLAGAYALTGNKREALNELARVAEMGLVYRADADEDFNSIKDTLEFKKILKRFEANTAPVGSSSTAFTVPEKGLVTEGVAYDPAEDAFYVSSVRARKIFKVGRDGHVKEFAGESNGLWSAMGMKVDARRRQLWVATAAVPQMTNYRKEEDGQSGILKFDLKTGKLTGKYILPNTPRPHWLGDLTLDSRGDVFATDSLTPALYVLREGSERLEPLIEGAPFVSPQGLAFSDDEQSLFLADYAKGLFVYDVKTGGLAQLSHGPNVALIGIDGLYFYKRSLIAIQNGTRPHRVVRVFLSADFKRAERLEVIEANNPLFDEPTLGVIVKESFYYVADSQWGALDKTGKIAAPDKLRETVILKVKL
jgi:sugar lactone lactonase YvrE